MLEHRTREHEAAIERVTASAAAVADLLSGLEGSSMEARREAIRICEGIEMVAKPCF